jgi:hypothetical protein
MPYRVASLPLTPTPAKEIFTPTLHATPSTASFLPGTGEAVLWTEPHDDVLSNGKKFLQLLADNRESGNARRAVSGETDHIVRSARGGGPVQLSGPIAHSQSAPSFGMSSMLASIRPMGIESTGYVPAHGGVAQLAVVKPNLTESPPLSPVAEFALDDEDDSGNVTGGTENVQRPNYTLMTASLPTRMSRTHIPVVDSGYLESCV